MTSPERTSVYRLYSAADQLLYVGIAKRFGSRWEQHAKAQPWWDQVDHQTVGWCASREDALLAEKRAIYEERPVYNKMDSPWEAVAKDDGTGFDVLPRVKRPRSRSDDRHKTGLIAWRSKDPTLRQWIRAEAGRRGVDQKVLLDEMAAEYREKHDPDKGNER